MIFVFPVLLRYGSSTGAVFCPYWSTVLLGGTRENCIASKYRYRAELERFGLVPIAPFRPGLQYPQTRTEGIGLVSSVQVIRITYDQCMDIPSDANVLSYFERVPRAAYPQEMRHYTLGNNPDMSRICCKFDDPAWSLNASSQGTTCCSKFHEAG